ncbi:MAG: protease inhibitor I42 family protein [Akkermansia sp.]|nr:protease inhibitor I42 family protein [Akkermansia sp.]
MMKYKETALLLGATVLATTTTAAGNSMELEVGQSTVITLRGNPTTGFVWQVTEHPQAVKVELAFESTKTAPNERPICGRPRNTIVTITGVQAGHGTVRLIYSRPWEKDAPPAKTKVLNVTVR